MCDDMELETKVDNATPHQESGPQSDSLSEDSKVASRSADYSAILDLLTRFREEGRERRAQINLLKESFAALNERESFTKGDIVVWKDRMKNRRIPSYGEPSIVLETFDPPLIEPEESAGSQYYRERLSVRLGFFSEEGDFISFLYDGRRFRKLATEEEDLEKIVNQVSG